MAFIGYLLWFVFGGGIIAWFLWIVLGALLAIAVVGLPFTVAAFRLRRSHQYRIGLGPG